MNNQSPLVPQGSLLDQRNKNRARVKIAVFFVLGVHGIGLMALLMQGCRQEKPSANEADTTTNRNPAMVETGTPVDTNPPPVVAAVTNPPPVVEPPSTTTALTPSASPAGSDYTIASGDTLGAIARKNHVSLTALKEANPGVEPTKLKIGQKLHIPAPAPAVIGGRSSTPTTT